MISLVTFEMDKLIHEMLMLTGFNYFIPKYANDWEFGESYLKMHTGGLVDNIRIRIRHTRSKAR